MSETCDLLCLDLPKAEALRAQQLDLAVAERTVARAQAFSDPTRLNIAAVLSRTDELCGCDISWITGRSQKLVSHHLKVLRQAELVKARRDGRIVYFSLTATGRSLLDAVLAPEEALA